MEGARGETAKQEQFNWQAPEVQIRYKDRQKKKELSPAYPVGFCKATSASFAVSRPGEHQDEQNPVGHLF
jgi:hypothetical protein